MILVIGSAGQNEWIHNAMLLGTMFWINLFWLLEEILFFFKSGKIFTKGVKDD